MTKVVIQIAWASVISHDAFQLGFRHVRENTPPDAQVGDTYPEYQLGRGAALEAPYASLPSKAAFFTMQMRMLIEQCPAMVDEFKKSALRFYQDVQAGRPINIGDKQ